MLPGAMVCTLSPHPTHCRCCKWEVLPPPPHFQLSLFSKSFHASSSLGREFKFFNKVNALNLIPRGLISFVKDNEKSEFRPAPNYTLHRSLQLAYMLIPSTCRSTFLLTIPILQMGQTIHVISLLFSAGPLEFSWFKEVLHPKVQIRLEGSAFRSQAVQGRKCIHVHPP